MKVLLATQKPFAPQAVEGISKIVLQSGHTIEVLEKYESEAELAQALKGVQALIVRSDKVGAQTIAQADDLKIIVRAGAGYDNIDIEAATKAGVVVMNTPGQNANAVAELAIGLMIYMARNQFNPSTGVEIAGKTLGIQGFGNVGSLVAAKALALGMKVRAFDPVKSDEDMLVRGVEPTSSVKTLYADCDYISLNLPLVTVTERTREIGIRRSLGAQRSSIVAQFLIESGMLCGMGGIVGIIFGTIGSLVLGKFLFQMTIFPATWVTLAAFGLSVALGVLFGSYPAAKASKLQPVEALRAD